MRSLVLSIDLHGNRAKHGKKLGHE
jgi:hypothetical protein